MNTIVKAICKINTLIFLFCSSSLYAAAPTHPELASKFTKKPLVSGKSMMVVTNNPFATKTAYQILKAGGNAFDAAIAAGFVLGLTEPQSSGIGGGGYALTYSAKDKKLLAYDGRETAPLSATSTQFLDKDGKPLSFEQAILNPKSIGVPGEVALFYKLHSQYGKLPFAKLVEPAIQLAEKGFPLGQRTHAMLVADSNILKNHPNAADVFFKNGKVKNLGSQIKNPAYAETLKMIAKNPQIFYQGKLADDIIHYVNESAHETIFTPKDFAGYEVKVYPALCGTYRKIYNVCTIPPSSGGGVTLLQLLNIYSTRSHIANPEDPNWFYYFLEAANLAYADRNQYLADPDFAPQPIKGLLDTNYLKARSELISDVPLPLPVPAGKPNGIQISYAPDLTNKLPGTTSLVIVDKENNAISMTLTVEHQFGSHFFTNGFFLNNELTDFSFLPKNETGQLIANRIEPGKRPRSSIAPVIVFKEGHLYALSGSPGGSEIICYVAKNLILMLDMKMTPEKASASVNFCSTNLYPFVENFSKPILQVSFLEKKGEKISRVDLVSGVTNILKKPTAGWYGAADPRREGLAIGD